MSTGTLIIIAIGAWLLFGNKAGPPVSNAPKFKVNDWVRVRTGAQYHQGSVGTVITDQGIINGWGKVDRWYAVSVPALNGAITVSESDLEAA